MSDSYVGLDSLPTLDPLPDLDPLEPLEDLEPLESMETEIAPKPIVRPVVKVKELLAEPAPAPSQPDVAVPQSHVPVVYTHENQFTQASPYVTENVVIISRHSPYSAPPPARKPTFFDKIKTKKDKPTEIETKKDKPKEIVVETKETKQPERSGEAPHEMGDPSDYFRIENWYEDLKEHTFRTCFLELTLSEAKVITQYRESHKMHMQLMAWQIREGKVAAPPSEAAYREMVDKELLAKLKQEDLLTISNIIAKLDGAIASLGCSTQGVFVRLSTRSPKDSALSSEKMKRLVREAIRQSTVTDPIQAMNEDLNIFITACSEALRVESGKEAVDLLLHSNRVMEDIMRCELVMKDVWSMQLIVREWWQGLYPPFEFRCFVYGRRLTAITQYYSLCYLSEMVDKKARIQAAILAKWEQLKDQIKAESYTIDFALSRDLSEVWVVELNHLPPTAGTALFDFVGNAADRAQIETGLAPGATEPALEFRIRTGICSNIATNPELGFAAIHVPIRNVIDEARGRPLAQVLKTEPTAVAEKPRRGCVVS